jgi:acetate kinase
MTAALEGIDALVFTGGVGERANEIRGGAARDLGFLGVAVDAEMARQIRDVLAGRLRSSPRQSAARRG